MIKSSVKRKDVAQDILLPAELCFLTGLPENINEHQRTTILRNGQKNPQQKIEAITKLIEQLKNKSLLREFEKKSGLEISEKCSTFNVSDRTPRPLLRLPSVNPLSSHEQVTSVSQTPNLIELQSGTQARY